MGVKFGIRAKFHPHRCNDKGIGPLKLKFLLIFGQNVEYKRPAGAYPLCDFHKICRICTSFQDALAVKVSLNFLKGLWSYGRFMGEILWVKFGTEEGTEGPLLRAKFHPFPIGATIRV